MQKTKTKVKGIVYDCSNEYIAKKLITFAQKSNINFSSFGYYVVVEKPIDFKKFKFVPKRYYFRRLGEIGLVSWNNKVFDPDIIFNKKISKYCFKLIKTKKYIYLHIKKRRYKLKSTIHLIPYFYRRAEKEFFEKDYNLFYTDESNIDNSINNSIEDINDIAEAENNYDKHDVSEEYVSSFEKNKESALNIKLAYDIKSFNFDVFYDNYFVDLTEIQKKVVALLLLGIRVTDISRLLETTQVNTTLALQRLGKKIRKKYINKKIKFVGIIKTEEEDD
jgi:hypothetical protein